VFVDLDGSTLQPVMACGLDPHIVVESSPGRFHAYWRVDALPLDQFGPVQRTIADRFNGDRTVTDLCRVMRLPGFPHRKAVPFMTKVIA
jgi:RepB DNA-primase from phage plasmid